MGGGNWHVNDYKYPPKLYYVVYGGVVSIALYLFLKSKKTLCEHSLFLFIAHNTIWIYLYHIPFVQLTGLIFSEWYVRYPIVYVSATIVCMLQTKMVDILSERYGKKSFYKYLKG